MSRASALYEFQQTELALEAGQRRLTAIAAELADDSSVRPVWEAAERVRAELQRLNVRQRDLELEIGSLSAQATELHRKLYGGRGGNPKQLMEFQTEHDSLLRRQRLLEDELLEVMVELEDAGIAAERAQATLAEAESSRAATQEKLREEQATLTAHQEQLTARHEMAEMTIPAADRELYDSLRRRKGGQAVARISAGACGVCGMAVTSSQLQQSRHQDILLYCSNCARILYVPDVSRPLVEDD